MAKKINLDSEVTLTVSQLKRIFQYGMEFENEVNLYDTDEIEEVTALDFDDVIKEYLDLELE